MPKAIIDELTSLPISRQRRYQLRKHRDRKCIRCGQPAVKQGYFCETHRQVHNVLTRELQRRRLDFKHRDYESESYGFSFSYGRQVYHVANTYLDAARSNASPTKTSEHLRVALVIGFTAVDVLIKAHALRVERGDHHIADEHVADAIEQLLATRPRLPVEEHIPARSGR